MKDLKIVKRSEASRLIGVSRYFVEKFIKENKLIQIKIGNTKFITTDSLRRVIAETEGSEIDE